MVKKNFYEEAYLQTDPTEKGMKDLDVFHPSYRVKRINEPVANFNPKYRKNSQPTDDLSIFLDIL